MRTQARITQCIQVSNAPLAATFSTLLGGTNTALEATLQFAVVANTSSISKIQMFSTGGSLGSVSNQSTGTFTVAASYLGIGLHPFYAVVTANTGVQYRSETKWIRIIGPDSAFPVSLVTPPPTIWWPATAGRGYDVLTMTSPGSPVQLTASLTPSNSVATWTDTNSPAPQRFYRVRTSN